VRSAKLFRGRARQNGGAREDEVIEKEVKEEQLAQREGRIKKR